jgi:hypothetical protein
MASKTYWLAASAWTIVGGVAGLAGGFALKPTKPDATFEQPPAVVVQAAKLFPAAKVHWGGSGVYKVPGQAAPGKYGVGVSGDGCIWHRWRSGDDPLKSIIESGTLNRGAFAEVTVAATDDRLELVGDCTWARQ